MKAKIIELPKFVLFPGAVVRASSVNKNSKDGDQFVVVPTKDGKRMPVGVMARCIKTQNSTLYEGLYRVRLSNPSDNKNDKIDQIKEQTPDRAQVSKRVDMLKDSIKRLLDLTGTDGSRMIKQFTDAASEVQSPGKLVDILCAVLPFTFDQKLELLNELDVVKRIDHAVKLIDIQAGNLEKAVVEYTSKKQPHNRSGSAGSRGVTIKTDKKSRERLLRSQLNTIKKELKEMGSYTNDDEDGELNGKSGQDPGAQEDQEDDDEDGLKTLKKKLTDLKLTEDARRIVNREMKRLQRMHPSQAEYNVTRSYLETIVEIPWSDDDHDQLSLQNVSTAKKLLDEEHYGLHKVKKRLVEYLTVLYLRQQSGIANNTDNTNSKSGDYKTPILLLVGPPGVGKTSLAKSVAKALNRKLHRISLGGLRDEAELKGHRRTYVSAMPGEFTKALIKTKVKNPVIVLDEIDKLVGPNHQGDPTGVMLEVLDPESNGDYFDRYVSFPIDLSKVLFIATANNLDTISPPLLDRMETIHIEGYTYREKEEIALKYLVPRQVRAAGLTELTIPPEVIREIATKYTREAGVRNLEREIGTLCRAKAVELVDNQSTAATGNSSSNESTSKTSSTIGLDQVEKYLGLPKFSDEVVNDQVDEYEVDGVIKRRTAAGVVNGLAYTGSGNGGILKFEATSMKSGTGKLKLTGKLGEVISESAQIALSWVKSNCSRFDLDANKLNEIDIHLHAPAGAIPKDGPSAGVAMTIALVSLLTDRVVPGDIAMTGEMTLRGKVLEVGGIREKLLGAHLAGVTTVLVPFNCQKKVQEDCGDLDLNVVYVKYIWDALKYIWPDHRIVLDSRL